ncbi:MAG: molybdopterin-dependent oxidoreductase [Candidatus Manganitrophus sp.]|nr:MAG: molybdopterin-dependent oxidoreductase [Candidatus Manganitrophus sp.]
MSSTDSFARDYHMDGELAATPDGTFLGPARQGGGRPRLLRRLRRPDQVPGRAVPHLHRLLRHPRRLHAEVKGVYTNKAPGGVAYRCSFRVTEAVYLIERMVDVLAQKLGMDPAELRAKNFIRKEQFPYTSAFSAASTTRGDYQTALDKAMDRRSTTRRLRAEQPPQRPERAGT